MKEVQELHRTAMDLAEEAAFAQAAGHAERARKLYLAAFEKECQAAECLDQRFDLEPTRSVLYRSAATLALDCGEHRAAEKLIARALIGDPPLEIAEELRDLLETVYFQRHLAVRGVVLEPNEFQVSISGKAVGFGVAESDAFITRIQDIRRLIYRTAERRAGKSFREQGQREGKVGKQFGIWLSVPRASSFAVTFRVGYSTQVHLPGFDRDPIESIISDLFDCLDRLGKDDPNEIVNHIPDVAYRRNFIALARRIAPDGEDVTAVGFTAVIGGGERRISLTRTADEMGLADSLQTATTQRSAVVVKGTLKFGSSLKAEQNEIRLVDTEGATHHIIVPKGYMDDIVRPLWDCDVRVEGVRKGRKIVLLHISPVMMPSE